MKICPDIAMPLLCIVAMTAAFACGFLKSNEQLPSPLTDEQIAAEVKHCNSLGLVYQLDISRRIGFCAPPTTIEVRQ